MRNDKIILVTGANRGIGFEICRQLADRGAQVILTAREPERGQQAARELQQADRRIDFRALDVSADGSVSGMVAALQRDYRRVDVLINNAGVLLDEDAPGLKVPLSVVRTTFETNALGPLRLSQGFAPLLQASKAGRIINMSSGMGALSSMEADHAAYRISKAALNAVTGILSAELNRNGIAVNSMCPGWVRTDMGGQNAQRSVAEGADTAVWLALDAPQSLTGNFIRDRQVIPW